MGSVQRRRLLAHALRKALPAGEAAAARLVVVDAIHEAAVAFYERHGFIAVPQHPRWLYQRTKDIRANFTRDPWSSGCPFRRVVRVDLLEALTGAALRDQGAPPVVDLRRRSWDLRPLSSPPV